MLILIAIYLALFAYLAWRRLDWALMLIIFALWSYLIRFSVLGLPTTLLEAMIIIAFVVWLIKERQVIIARLKKRFKKDSQVQRYPFDWEMIAVLVVAVLAVATTGWTNTALGVWKAYFLEPIIFFLLVFNVLGKDKQYDKIFCPLSVATILISVVAIYQKITGSFVVPDFWTAIAERATSLFAYPNAVGLYLAPMTLLLLGWLGYQLTIKQKKILVSKIHIAGIAVAIILSVLAIISAQSDGALAALLGAVIVVGLLANRRLMITTIIVVIVGVTAIAIQPTIRQKVIDKVTLFDLSGQIRKQQWHETWRLLSDDNWLLGVGLSNYQQAVAPYHQAGIFVKNHDPQWLDKVLTDPVYHKASWQPLEIYLYPHNILFNFWSELGILGVLLFTWLIIKYLVIGIKQLWIIKTPERYLTLGLIGAMMTIIIHGLVDVPYFKNDLAMLFWLLFAILGILQIHSKKRLS